MTTPTLPDAVRRWMRSTKDPWNKCERADWLIYVAHARNVPMASLIAALARCMPKAEFPPELRDLSTTVDDLIGVLATRTNVPEALEEAIRTRLVPQVIDWNHGHSYGVLARFGATTPEGIPPPAAELEPLRARANAALRLKRASEQYQRGDEQWHAALALVALYIVFHQLGGGNPLYNQIAMDPLSRAEAAVHERVCRQLRTEIDALMASHQ